MRAINTVPVAFNHKRTTCICPTTKLASFLFKERRLSQASLELSSLRGVFGSQENKGKRREKREYQTLTKATRLYLQNENLPKDCFLLPPLLLRVTKWEGAYIGHPMYENTTKPNNLAKIRDKGVIHQN